MKRPLFLLLISSVVLCCSCNQEPISSHPPPNIILIVADDLGYGDVGCYGQSLFSTPHIDQLANSGMLFRQFYAGSTVCAPSRAVLMTGKHTGHAFVRGNTQRPDGFGQLPLPPSELTFVQHLKTAGYATGAFGKWGLGNHDTEGNPLQHGFDVFFGYHDQVLAHNSYPEYLFHNNEKVSLSNEVHYLSKEEWHKGLGSVSSQKIDYSNDLIFQEALNFVENNREGPFFLYFPTTIPHDNGEADIGERFEVPNNSRYQDTNWSADEKSYAALVEHLDGYVGQLQQKLEEWGLRENTIILFTSDNGPLPTQHLNSAGPLRGYKRDLYEGGIRVPLIVSWPGHIQAGQSSNHVSAYWDLYPTMCEIAGITDIPETDGLSFLPELLGQPQDSHAYLYWEFHWWKSSRQAIRWGTWKAIRNAQDADWELYNLDADISETNDLAPTLPDIVKQAEQILSTARTSSERYLLQ